MIPAALANVTPIFASRIPYLRRFDYPIDNNRMYHSRPIFGPHKTWRGLLTGTIVAVTTVYAQTLLWQLPGLRSLIGPTIDYAHISIFLYGIAFGLGALGGDALESFFKRRFNIASGNSWLLFDQVDYVLGAIVATMLLVLLPLYIYVEIIVIFVLVHLLSSYVGFRMGLKDKPI